MLHPNEVSEQYKTVLGNNSPDLYGSLKRDAQIGRFRPLSWTYVRFLCFLFRYNTQLFRLSNLLILFLSAFFLLSVFSLFKVDSISSITMIAFYIFGRNNETWWTFIPPQQDIGEMCLLAGVFFWLLYRKVKGKGYYIIPALFFLLAGLIKESFIFTIPVFLLTDYFFFSPLKRLLAREYLFSSLSALIPFICLLITILYSKMIYIYPYPESTWSIFAYNGFQFAGGAGFFIVPIVLLVMRWRMYEEKFLTKIFFVLILWSIIQLILLKGIKLDDQHHYLIPWLIYPLILTAIAMNELKKIIKIGYGLMIFTYWIAILLFAKNTYATSSSYCASLQAYYTMIDTIRKDTATNGVIYMSTNPIAGDWIEGTRVIMDIKGIKKKLYFASTTDSIPAWGIEYSKHIRQNVYKRIPLDSVFKTNRKWIILVGNPAKNGVINGDISFYSKKDSDFVEINGIVRYIPGKYYYFSVPYPGRSIGDLLKGNFNPENRRGFYAIKLY